MTRCPAPTRAAGGVLRCVVTAARCDDPAHVRWRRITPLMAVVWWLKPWWPNRRGRAMDRGDAHTCPTVLPCRRCLRDLRGRERRCGDPTCREDHR